MERLKLVPLILLFLLFFALAGCKGKSQRASINPSGSTPALQIKDLDSAAWERLAAHGILRDNVTLVSVSPDTTCAALALDSTVRIGKGDEMWSEELPSDWYGERHPSLLYLYDLSRDTLSLLMEFEQIVDFYYTQNAQPVEATRKQSFVDLSWSPQGKYLLVIRDFQESDGKRFQNALIFTPGIENPTFLDIFSTWQTLVHRYQDSPGTLFEESAWLDSTRIRIELAVLGVIPQVRVEVIFDATSGELLASKELTPS